METVPSLTLRAGRPAIWTERSARLCKACSQHAIAVYTRFRSRGSVAMRTSSRRRPKPVSPSKPANPSKPHKPVLSRSARGSTNRVSGGRVSGGGTGVWANVGGPGKSKLVASIPVAIHVEHWVFFIEPPFLSTFLREPTLSMIINVKVHSLQELCLYLSRALVQGQRAGGIARCPLHNYTANPCGLASFPRKRASRRRGA